MLRAERESSVKLLSPEILYAFAASRAGLRISLAFRSRRPE
jgi:hypothetical protein